MSQTTVQARYQVISRIASGGMGEVYRARDAVLGRDVAIKVLHRNLAGDDGFIERFRREARSAALLSHPNIVGVHDWGSTTAGTYFMVMEFVPGRNVRDLLNTHGRLEPAQAAEILIQVLAALDHAHRHGIVHRDVKPENILVTPDGVIKVADFGLARAFAESRISQAPGTVTGTVQYLAPEQIRGDAADPRTDLYALGVVAFELLTGKVPYTGETSVAIAYRHLEERVPMPSLRVHSTPPALDRVVLSCTHKDPEIRPKSAAEVRKGLVHVIGSLPVAKQLPELVAELPPAVFQGDDRAETVTIPQPGARRSRFRRIRRWVLALVALAALLGGGAWAGWTYVVPHYTTLPVVLGVPLDQARNEIEAAGLKVRVGLPMASIDYQKGAVASERPFQGRPIRRGTEITIRVSSGLPLRTVPSVRGQKLAPAQTALATAGLKVAVKKTFSEHVAKDLVIDQNPSPGQRIEYGSTVRLTVSRGPAPVAVPQLVGRTSGDAEAILLARGFRVKRVQRYSAQVPLGEVIAQKPAEGKAPAGSRVRLIISLGPRTFPMPNVIGMNGDDARAQLEGMGLSVAVSPVPGASGNTVVGQIPSAGATVQQGASVRIFVA